MLRPEALRPAVTGGLPFFNDSIAVRMQIYVQSTRECDRTLRDLAAD
jgi:hypothetical protein